MHNIDNWELKVTNLLINNYRMYNLHAMFAKNIDFCKQIAGNLIDNHQWSYSFHSIFLKIELPLPAISFFKTLVYFCCELIILQSPIRSDKQLLRGLGDESLHDKTWVQTFHEINHQIDVFVHFVQMEAGWVLCKLMRHPCVPYQLQLVQLQRSQRKLGYAGGMTDNLLPALARQSQNQMGTDRNATGSCLTDCLFRLLVCVPPVNPLQSFVQRAFQSVFNHDEFPAGKLVEIIQQIIWHTIGTSPDNQSHHIGICQRLFIFGNQLFRSIVSIRVSLEIGKVLHFRILAGKETDSFVQLLRHALFRMAIFRAECLVVAIGAASPPFRPVPVRTSKTCVDRYFLHFDRKYLLQETTEFVISFLLRHLFRLFLLLAGKYSKKNTIPDKSSTSLRFMRLLPCQ